MPNHVTTILRAEREVIHALLTEDGVDFNRIIPMPDDVIRGSVGHANIDGEYQKVYYPEPDPDSDDPMGLRGKPIPYPEGATDWYEWSIEHWGTKWNAYDHEVSEDDTVVRFDTAWAHPYPVMTKLSEMFPDQILQVVYADEDLGNNFGVYAMKDGLLAEMPCPGEGTDEAADLASLIKYGKHYRDLYDEDEYEGEAPVVVFIDTERKEFTPLEVLAHAMHGPKEE